MKWMAFFGFLLSCYSSQAQNRVTYTISPNSNILDIIPVKDIYQYPDFLVGTVVFKDDRKVAGKLNYNQLIDAVQFINPNGDTLALADEQTIKYITINKDTFYYSKIYVRQVEGKTKIKLADRQLFKEFVQKPSSYGLSSSTTSSENISVVVADRSYTLNTNQEMILMKVKEYYLGNKSGNFLLADKKNIFRLFPKQTKNIGEYLTTNNTDFNKEEDLKKLLVFIETL